MPRVPASRRLALASSSRAASTRTRNAFNSVSLCSLWLSFARASAEDVLEPVQERPLLVLEVGHGQRPPQLLHELLLLARELLGHDHAHDHMEVPAAAGPEVGHALATNAQEGSRLRALGNVELRPRAVEGGHLDRGAQRGLGHVDGELAEEAGPL